MIMDFRIAVDGKTCAGCQKHLNHITAVSPSVEREDEILLWLNHCQDANHLIFEANVAVGMDIG